ncbi:LCP family protein [Paeniglutamicibacter sulfureus]|uniref:LCP family protein required for cell wall assembly n=1 Tax=Paeniglutamicibacter sulfureus TaxID=43666 RepID=A0ABU2BFX5_9MICC|nr:LCP family protein [Paeniglutamicibacter sulfureus]MDR7357532.1 LCP family protein required for cell wall assembly [Paeniglutamicibacter sulfureus]
MTSTRRSSHDPDLLPDPVSAPAPVRSKRALFLLLLTTFFPGSAQWVSGNRALGGFVMRVTITCWALLLVVLALALLKRDWLLGFFAQAWVQLGSSLLLVVLAAGWLLMFLNTLAIIRPRYLAPGARIGLTATLLVVALAITGSLGYGAFVMNKGRETISSVFTAGPAFKPVDGRYNIAVFGADSAGNREGVRTDSMSLLSVDAKTGKSLLISIPRNMQNAQFSKDSPMRKIYPEGYNCGDECLFNAIYRDATDNHADLYPDAANPGAEATMDAIEGSTGLKVQSYVMIDMAGFAGFINAMGGVKVDSGGWVPYNGKSWPNSSVNTHWFAPGEQTLTGKQALWFARSRDFTSDYHRIARQQCLQQAMISQFSPKTMLTRFTSIMDAGEQLVETDIPQQQLGSFLNLADKARQTPFKRLTLGAPDFGSAGDKFSTYPKFDEIHSRIDELIAAQNESPAKKSAEATKESAKEKESSAPAKSTKDSGTERNSEPGKINTAPSDAPTAQPDGSELTERYLVTLEQIGRTDLLAKIAANNNECSVP